MSYKVKLKQGSDVKLIFFKQAVILNEVILNEYEPL